MHAMYVSYFSVAISTMTKNNFRKKKNFFLAYHCKGIVRNDREVMASCQEKGTLMITFSFKDKKQRERDQEVE